jgi:hypothetical protein
MAATQKRLSFHASRFRIRRQRRNQRPAIMNALAKRGAATEQPRDIRPE